MPSEKSAGAIVFRKENNQDYYLLLHYPSSARAGKNYWDFPKGHMEKGEEELDTMKREVEEETGITGLKLVEGFREVIDYFFRFKEETIFKTVVFYLAETGTKEVKISDEHLGFEWLPYKEAFAKLKFKNAKNLLKKAGDYLKKNEKENF